MTLSEGMEVVFCIGSNCGDREVRVAAGIEWLSKAITEFRHSSIYATPDCHGGQRKYMNAVVAGSSDMHPYDLERLCKDYEIACGRDSIARVAGDVPVDIDLVVYGGKILREKDFSSEFFLKGYREIYME